MYKNQFLNQKVLIISQQYIKYVYLIFFISYFRKWLILLGLLFNFIQKSDSDSAVGVSAKTLRSSFFTPFVLVNSAFHVIVLRIHESMKDEVFVDKTILNSKQISIFPSYFLSDISFVFVKNRQDLTQWVEIDYGGALLKPILS